MWERVVRMLEDPVQDIHNPAQQTLIALMKYSDFTYPAALFFP
jgi:hypothetical protein